MSVSIRHLRTALITADAPGIFTGPEREPNRKKRFRFVESRAVREPITIYGNLGAKKPVLN